MLEGDLRSVPSLEAALANVKAATSNGSAPQAFRVVAVLTEGGRRGSLFEFVALFRANPILWGEVRRLMDAETARQVLADRQLEEDPR